jgi:hypothetical protein
MSDDSVPNNTQDSESNSTSPKHASDSDSNHSSDDPNSNPGQPEEGGGWSFAVLFGHSQQNQSQYWKHTVVILKNSDQVYKKKQSSLQKSLAELEPQPLMKF